MDSRKNTVDRSENTCLIEHSVNPTEPATHAVVEAVAAVSDTDVKEMPSLYDSVATEALDQLVAPNGASRTDVIVQFTYCGKLVRVNGKTIELHPSEEVPSDPYSPKAVSNTDLQESDHP